MKKLIFIIIAFSASFAHAQKKSEKPYEVISKTSAVSGVNIKQYKGTDVGLVTVVSKALDKGVSMPGSGLGIATKDQDGNNVGQGIGGALTPAQASIGPGGKFQRNPENDITASKNYTAIYQVSNYSISEGNFTNVFKSATDKTATTEFQGVTFPFHGVLNFDDQSVEFVLKTPGTYRIDVTIAVEK